MSNYEIKWDSVEKEAVEILRSYLQINTTNPPGNETAGAVFLKKILEDEGILCEIFESQPGRGSLISGCSEDRGIPDVILLHHIDVVPAEEKKWNHPPFSAAYIDGEIWGRGAVDCKSLGVMELMAFILLKRQGISPERHVVYAATADEEAGGKWGVQWLLEHHPSKLSAGYIINEGMGLGINTENNNLYFCQVAEKGANWIRINFEGKPGHASLPHRDNCVVEMAKAIDALSHHEFPIHITGPVERFIYEMARVQEFMPERDFLDMLDESQSRKVLKKIPLKILRRMIEASLKHTLVPTVVSAGTKTNVIPSSCFCEVDCRILPGSTPDDLLKTITEILRERGCRNFSIEFLGESLSSESPPDTPLYELLEKSIKKNDPKGKMVSFMSTGATDSRFFRQKGIPAYGIQIDSSLEAIETVHGHNERIRAEKLTMGIKILYDILREVCSGNL